MSLSKVFNIKFCVKLEISVRNFRANSWKLGNKIFIRFEHDTVTKQAYQGRFQMRFVTCVLYLTVSFGLFFTNNLT